MILFELTTPSGQRVGVDCTNGGFWVLRLDEKMPQGWQWVAVAYPPVRSLEATRERLYAAGVPENAPAWLAAGWRAKVDQQLEVQRGQAATTSP